MIISLDNRSGETLPLHDLRALAAFVLCSEGVEAVVTPEHVGGSAAGTAAEAAAGTGAVTAEAAADVGAVTAKVAAAELELSLSFVDEEEIHELNRTWRGIDAATDVLSFENDDELLGDVIICPAVARSHAEVYGSSFEAEMALMITHGILHLLGYDHEDDTDAELMEARENELVARWSAR